MHSLKFRLIAGFGLLAVLAGFSRVYIKAAIEKAEHASEETVELNDAVQQVIQVEKALALQSGLQAQYAIRKDDAILEEFEETSETLGQRFQPSEGMVRLLAQVVMGADTASAIELGNMWSELYPESFRGPVFLGDLWAAQGDEDRALQYYEMALARSPGNEAVREKIAKLGS